MISRLGEFLGRTLGRWIPDPFVIAVLLTVATAGLAVTFGNFGSAAPLTMGERAARLLDTWRGSEGLWKFLAFGMQMCLVLITGSVLVAAPMVSRGLDRLAEVPRSRRGGAVTIATVACTLGLLNWGLGLVAGALLARRMADEFERRGHSGHRAVFAASGYTGMMIWHGGLSGSAPLTMTTMVNAQKALPPVTIDALVGAGFGAAGDPNAVMVPLSQTIFSPLNLVVSLGLLVIIPLVAGMLAGADDITATSRPVQPKDSSRQESGVAAAFAMNGTGRAAERLHASPIMAWLLGTIILGAFARFVQVSGVSAIGIDQVNMAMLGVGVMLHRSLASYAAAAENAAKECAGIILQFPLYAGIMGMMVVSGLVAQIALWGVGLVGPSTLPIAQFGLAALVNLFVPSGGGQWGVQGPIAIQVGLESGVSPGRLIMAVAYGDQLTNMLQPFWALPLLSVTRTKANELVGPLAIIMVVGAAWIAGCLMLVP